MELGFDPMNGDSDGDGVGDGDEFVGGGVRVPIYVPTFVNDESDDGDDVVDDGEEVDGESDPVRD